MTQMLHKPLFKESLFLILIIGALNYFAIKYYWYWIFDSFDSFMHFLGGAWVVLSMLWLYFFSGFFAPSKRRLFDFFLISILGLGFVSIAWEIYELLAGSTYVAWAEYNSDTALDFVMDFLGGVAACLYGYMYELESKKAQMKIEIHAGEF